MPTMSDALVNTDLSTPLNTFGAGIPIDWKPIEDGAIPIFWGDNQYLNEENDTYENPSKMGGNQTMHLFKVCRFIYTFKRDEDPGSYFCKGAFIYSNYTDGDGFFVIQMLIFNNGGIIVENQNVVFANTTDLYQEGAINILWGTSQPHPTGQPNTGTGKLESGTLTLNGNVFHFGD